MMSHFNTYLTCLNCFLNYATEGFPIEFHNEAVKLRASVRYIIEKKTSKMLVLTWIGME